MLGFVVHPDLVWLAVAFVTVMAGMLAAAPVGIYGPHQHLADWDTQVKLLAISLRDGPVIPTARNRRSVSRFVRLAGLLWISERDQRLELVAARFAFPQMLYASRYADHSGRNIVSPQHRHSLGKVWGLTTRKLHRAHPS